MDVLNILRTFRKNVLIT